MITDADIQSLKPLAIPRGFDVVAQTFGDHTNISLKDLRVPELASRGMFATAEAARKFLADQPVQPRFRAQMTYTNGRVNVGDVYAADRHQAFVRVAALATVLGQVLDDEPWELQWQRSG
ncbi:MAG TPA: hypothetical protein VN719_09465 [Gemmatimonadales bacterium]|nr:hypothetical protein [Gemmatimonadales bacterium]